MPLPVFLWANRFSLYCQPLYKLAYAIQSGVVPVAPHLLYPQVLKEHKAKERAMGMELGVSFISFAQAHSDLPSLSDVFHPVKTLYRSLLLKFCEPKFLLLTPPAAPSPFPMILHCRIATVHLDEEMLKAAGLAESEEYQVIFGSGAIVLTDGKPERIVLSIVDLLWMLKQEE